MKNYIFLLFFYIIKSSYSIAQDFENQVLELENFIIQTDQDLYLSGDRVWFGAKLLKNHDSFRYSKLAYISVVDHQGQEVYREKMLLSGQDMVFGDIFLSENSPSGVYSLLIYTKWMTSFKNFPVAKKNFLVINPKLPQVSGEPTLFGELNPFENPILSILHTSPESELIELQDSRGKTLQIIEQVPGLKKVFLKIPNGENLSLIFRNQKYPIPRLDWSWDPKEYSLKRENPNSDGKHLVVHTDWKIIEQIDLKDGSNKIDESLVSGYETYKLTVLNSQNNPIWTYQVKNPSYLPKGKVVLPPVSLVNEPFQAEFSGLSNQSQEAFVLVKQKEDIFLEDWVEILNNPNWKEFNQENSQEVSTISNLHLIEHDSIYLKDYSPMFGYKALQLDPAVYFPEATNSKSYSFELPKTTFQEKVKRKIYQNHFGIQEEVVELTSPFTPDEVFIVGEYFAYESFEKFAKEILFPLKIKKSKTEDKKELWVANTDNYRIKFDKKPLVLIDFYRITDLEELFTIDMNTLDKIEIYYHRTTVQKTNLGSEVGDGLILVYSKNNSFALKNNIPNSRNFLRDVSVPRTLSIPSIQFNPSSNTLQAMFPQLKISKGKTKTPLFNPDTAGEWSLEALIFEKDKYYSYSRKFQIILDIPIERK